MHGVYSCLVHVHPLTNESCMELNGVREVLYNAALHELPMDSASGDFMRV